MYARDNGGNGKILGLFRAHDVGMGVRLVIRTFQGSGKLGRNILAAHTAHSHTIFPCQLPFDC